MAKTKLFEAWSFRLQQPAPFDDPKYAGSKSMGFSQYNTSSTAQKSTLHAPTIRALLAYAKLVSATENGQSVDGLGAIGHQGTTYRISEYRSANKTDCVVFNPVTGKFNAAQVEDGTQALKPYSVGAGNGTGSGLLFCLMPVLNEDDEFRQKFQEFVSLLESGWADMDAAFECALTLCDNVYRRIENSKQLGSDGVKISIPTTGNISVITQMAMDSGNYSDLDALGRCGTACASIGQDLMPTESRGSIGMVKPTGWHTVRYDDLVDGKYLYNRCHLIGYQLTGENANTKNLITGTRYLNIEGMLPFENMVADYIEETNNHVLYRVTPIFEGNNLLANGVLMEGYSVEDKGAGVSYCVFAYNVQPGIEIDYATGESKLADGAQQEEQKTATVTPTPSPEPEKQEPVTGSEASQADYILNTNTKKFHYPTCSSVNDMKEKNRQEFFGTRDETIALGYSPCGRCKP